MSVGKARTLLGKYMDRDTNADRRSLLIGGALLVTAPSPLAAKAMSVVGEQDGLRLDPSDMPFPSLPPQGSINDRADAYGQTALTLSRVAAMTTRCARDVAYGKGVAQKLDIYLPNEASARDLPVFINIHGGAWRWGYKEWMGLNAPPIVAARAIYVSVEYSLAPAARYPKQLDDCTLALAWVYKNISRFGGNPAKILVGGHSAGAHLASLMTLRRDRLKQFNLPEDVIKACLTASGAYDFRDPLIYGLPKDNAFLNDFLASAADVKDVSPIAWTRGNRTPFLVTWGENDRDDAKFTAPAFVAVLRREQAPVVSHRFPLLDHFWMHVAQQSATNLWTRTAIAWLKGEPGVPVA